MYARLVAGALAGATGVLIAAPALAAPIAMEVLVARALEKVPALQAARATARAQRARVGIAKSAYFPQVAIGAGYARGQNVPPAPFGSPPGDGGTANATVHQELFNFGQTAAAVDAANASAEVSEAQAQLLAVEVGFDVRQAYIQWVQARGLETKSSDVVHEDERLLALATSFFKHGVRPRIDVTRAQVVLAQARADLADARNSVEIAHRSLETAIGGEAIGGEPFFPKEPKLVGIARVDLERLARRNHPGLAASGASLRLSQATREGASRLGMPDISANGIAGARAQELALGPDWQAGLNVSLPLFTGYSITSQQDAAKEAEQAATASLADRDLQIQLAVDRAHISIGGARAKLAAYEVALASAKENAQLAKNRYREGVGSIIEVSEAQTLLAGAQADWVRAAGSLQLAIATLEYAVGLTGLEKDVTP